MAEHAATIADQFTRQAALFAAAPALHDAAALDLLIAAAAPQPDDLTLDIACGPGSVVAAFATHVRYSTGLDATDAMLTEARKLANFKNLTNTTWVRGDAYALPFADAAFDIVTCRFAFHHFEAPERAFAEMLRVCRPAGRIVVCDATASDDPVKARAFNAMEKHRDPSTVAFRSLATLQSYFTSAGLAPPSATFYKLPAERERLIALSFPDNDDRSTLRTMIDASVDGDTLGMGSIRHKDTVLLAYPSVILSASKP